MCRKTELKNFYYLVFIVGLLVQTSFAQAVAPKVETALLQQKLQAKLDEWHKKGRAAGATLGVCLSDGVCFGLATGVSDLETGRQMKPSDLMAAGSVGKTYAAAVTLQLVKEGKINLDDRIEKHLGKESWFSSLPNAKDITVRQLMNHTSGLVRYELREDFTRDLTANPDKVWKPEELIAYLRDSKAPFEAGKGWDYSDTNYIVLGMIIEKVTGKKFYEEANRRVVKPLNMKNTFPQDRRELKGLVQGYAGADNPFGGKDRVLENGKFIINPQFEWTGGGWISTAEDLARWAKFMYEGKAFDASLLLQMLEGKDAPQLGPNTKYGLGAIIRPTRAGLTYGHSGFFPGYITEMAYFPEQKVSLAIQVNTSVPPNLGGHPGRLLVDLAGEIFGNSVSKQNSSSPAPTVANQPTASVRKSKIAFTSAQSGNSEIYTMNADGSEVRRLTANSATDRLPSWSPDCRTIAFESDRDGGARKIYLMNSNGENQRRLTVNAAVERFPAFSPDGKKLALTIYNGDRTADIYTINTDGSGQRRLTENAHEDAYPAWSPDGKKIAFHSYKHGKAQIFVMNAEDGSEIVRLTENSFGDFEPAWSPDGSKIAFVSNRDGNFEVYSMNPDGGDQQRLTRTELNESKVSWSPDGKQLIFGVILDSHEELILMGKNGAAMSKAINGEKGSLPYWSRC